MHCCSFKDFDFSLRLEYFVIDFYLLCLNCIYWPACIKHNWTRELILDWKMRQIIFVIYYIITYSLVIIHWGQFVHSLCFSPFVNLYTSVMRHICIPQIISIFCFSSVFHVVIFTSETLFMSQKLRQRCSSVSKEALLIFFQISTFSPLQTFCLLPRWMKFFSLRLLISSMTHFNIIYILTGKRVENSCVNVVSV